MIDAWRPGSLATLPDRKLDKQFLSGSASRQALLFASAFGSALLAGGAAHAQSNTAQLNQLEAQILQIQQQNAAEIAGLQQEIKQLKVAQQQTATTVAATRAQVSYAQPSVPLAVATGNGSSVLTPRLIESPTHQFGLSSANGANTISIIARVQFDGGDYLHVAPQGGYKKGAGPGSASAGPLDSGVDARRARFGIGGTFQNDWAYRFIGDFGGSSDSDTTGVSGASTSILENAYITYNGFYSPKAKVPVAFDLGYLDVPWTLDESTSSNDIMFMERSSSQVIATEFGGGDARAVFGARSNNKHYWVGAYLTGPTAGAPHTGAGDPAESALVRASYQLIQNNSASLHIGGNFAHLFQARSPYNSATTGVKTNSADLVLSDRPELRIDPTTILNTGGIPTHSATVWGAEAAGAFGGLFAQGEYFHYSVDQSAGLNPTDGLTNLHTPTLGFHGGYVEASYSIGGTRQYIPATGAYSGVVPNHNFDIHGGGWGALELAGRYSDVDLNDDLQYKVAPHVTGGVDGGEQNSYDIGLNWYPNVNMKFMLDFGHVSVSKVKPTTNGTVSTTADGATIDDIAARAQFAY